MPALALMAKAFFTPPMPLQKIFRFWFPVILYSAIIYYGSSLSLKKAPAPFPFFDKILHLWEYIPFGFLTGRALFHTKSKALTVRELIKWAVLLSLLYGLSDEFHQFFVPGRESCLSDALADMLGGALGAWIFVSWQKKRKNSDIR